MKKFIFGLGLLFVSSFASAQGVNGSYLRITPTTLPTLCRLGDVRVDSVSGSLSLCGASNNWAGLASGSNVPALTTLGDTLYEDATPAANRLPGNTTTTKKFLSQTGTGTISAAPAWATILGTDLPNPGASSLGGVQSYAAVSNQWINSISTSGVPSSTQPAFSNISGTVAASQLPNPSASTLGGVQSAAPVSNQWINSISTSGVPALSQPAFSNISGTASLTTQVTGTLPIANGGTNNGSLGVVAGSMYYADGSKLVSMGAGTAGQVPVSTGTAVGWGATVGGNFANLITNGDFSNSTTGWTSSGGTFTTVSNGVNYMGVGLNNATWDSSAAAQTLTSPSYTISSGYAGTNGLWRCKVMNLSGATQTMGTWDGSTLANATTIDPGTIAKYVEVAAPFGAAATTTAIRFTSVASNEPLISIADCYVGPNFNIGTVSQAIFVGESYFAGTASCVWARTSSTVGAFSTSATCPGPTVVRSYDGTWLTTDVDLPIQTVNNLPPGVYEATFQTRVANGAGNGALAINDGTTTCEAVYSTDDTTFNNGNTVTCTFEYTTAGNHSFQLYAASSGGTLNVNNTLSSSPRASTKFTLKRYPSQSQVAVRADSTPGSWSGYHDGNCSWTTTSTTLADPSGGGDASCTFTQLSNTNFGTVSSYTITSNNAPGIVFTPNISGKYFVCAGVNSLANSAAGGATSIRLVDGSSNELGGTTMGMPSNGGDASYVCGILNTTSGASATVKLLVSASGGTSTINLIGGTQTGARAIQWSIFAITQNLPAPLLVGSVTSSSSGLERTERVSFGGASEPSVCSSSPCTMYRNTPAITSVTRTGAGLYTINFATGAFLSAPVCVSQNTGFSLSGWTQRQSGTVPTATAYQIQTIVNSVTGDSGAVDVICMGPR